MCASLFIPCTVVFVVAMNLTVLLATSPLHAFAFCSQANSMPHDHGCTKRTTVLSPQRLVSCATMTVFPKTYNVCHDDIFAHSVPTDLTESSCAYKQARTCGIYTRSRALANIIPAEFSLSNIITEIP